MEKNKICPLFSIGGGGFVSCQQDSCGFYNDADGQCAFVSLADNVNDLQGYTDDVRDSIDDFRKSFEIFGQSIMSK